jgi:hypothetical protein
VAEREIVVIERSDNDNGYLDKAAEKNASKNPIRCSSKADMVAKILATLGPNDCIKRLRIIGHGAPGNISTGDGQGREPCKHIDNNRRQWAPALQPLVGRFCADASIFLEGCNTGAEQAGADKLHELALFFGVTVAAYTGKVYGDGSTENGTRVQRVRPGEVRPPAIPKPD